MNMSKIKELILEDGIRIMPKPDSISYEEIQECLNKAHSINEKRGLIYATQNQTIEKLKEKLQNAVTYIAVNSDNKIIATASIQFRKINHWYHNGNIGLLKLLGVSPEYSGRKLALLLLLLLRGFEAKTRKIEVIVSDSAEENISIRNLYLNNGFKVVDCCKYPTNSFISIVYAFWFHGCPYTNEEINEHFESHYEELKHIYTE